MFGKRFVGLFVLFVAAVLLVLLVAPTQAERQAPAETTIVVNSGNDPDDSKSKTCLTDTPCTLRRAIVQAGKAADRPVTISFNIPQDAAEGYNGALGVWELEILGTSDPSVFRRLEFGQISIDGTTQPGGRSDGPKIILVGPDNGNKDGIIVGVNPAGSHDQNVIRGLGFQNFKTHLFVNSNNNLIEENWFGLTSDGAGVYLRDDEPEDGSGSAAVALSAGVEDNTITGNVFLGFDGAAVAMRGENNIFSNNFVGTNKDGNVPGKQTEADLICTKVDWLGGGGISLEGEQHQVLDNIFAGIRQEISQTATQPAAVRSAGDDHQIVGNLIGESEDGSEVGVCGRGVYLISEPENVLVKDNTIVNPGLSAISLNGALSDANTFRGNVIKNRFQWQSDDEFNAEPEDAIQLGRTVPDELRDFRPARVTQINGQTVQGSNGVGSPCPACVVELFLDDDDAIKEALQSLAVVTADDDGNWTATIPIALEADQRLRTTSTSARFNTIPGLSAGTTTGLSGLYREQVPCTGSTGQPHGICVPLLMTRNN